MSKTLIKKLFNPIDIASLIYFRIIFGAIMLWEVYRYFSHDWIKSYWVEPEFNFTYYGFSWLIPLPEKGMYLLFVALGILAVFILLGFYYRLSAILFFLIFTYTFLLEEARYLNHFYLVSLVSFILIFLPCDRLLSIDSWLHPKRRSTTVPAWTLWLLRSQIAIPYFYAGVAKLNGDWLQGEPLRMWLAARTDFPLIGSYFTQEWMVYFLTYGGLILDLFVVPFLIWPRTRLAAFLATLVFHLMNVRLFSIGIFPWFMIGATLMFFSPSFPRLILRERAIGNRERGGSVVHGTKSKEEGLSRIKLSSRQYLTLTLLGIYLALQLLVPLRHHLYPGDVNWTEEGHRFAWRMKLRTKRGEGQFVVAAPEDGRIWVVDPEAYLTSWQARKMLGQPDMILQFAHYLAQEKQREGYENIEVRATVRTSLNGRKRQLLIDPTVNLVEESRNLKKADWILPLQTPLR